MASIFSLLTILALHWGQMGTMENVKLSLIQPLQFSPGHVQIAVISSGSSSNGLFRE